MVSISLINKQVAALACGDRIDSNFCVCACVNNDV
jgi:hypothetical protein